MANTTMPCFMSLLTQVKLDDGTARVVYVPLLSHEPGSEDIPVVNMLKVCMYAGWSVCLFVCFCLSIRLTLSGGLACSRCAMPSAKYRRGRAQSAPLEKRKGSHVFCNVT